VTTLPCSLLGADVVVRINLENPANGRDSCDDIPWLELARLCKAIRTSWYPAQREVSRQRYLYRLGRILERIPEDDVAIIRQEALAWFHQLKGDYAAAIRHRREEIRLMEWLQRDVQRCLESGAYDQSTARYALDGRGSGDLRDRRAILRSLEDKATSSELGKARRDGRNCEPGYPNESDHAGAAGAGQ
jgi:hypothetical protein